MLGNTSYSLAQISDARGNFTVRADVAGRRNPAEVGDSDIVSDSHQVRLFDNDIFAEGKILSVFHISGFPF